MPKGKLLITDAKNNRKKQHKNPCSDCPFRRDAVKGWLGGAETNEYPNAAHSDGTIHCHVIPNQQCAGSAIFRGNICKSPRNPDALVLPTNRISVFSSFQEFINHHTT